VAEGLFMWLTSIRPKFQPRKWKHTHIAAAILYLPAFQRAAANWNSIATRIDASPYIPLYAHSPLFSARLTQNRQMATNPLSADRRAHRNLPTDIWGPLAQAVRRISLGLRRTFGSWWSWSSRHNLQCSVHSTVQYSRQYSTQ